MKKLYAVLFCVVLYAGAAFALTRQDVVDKDFSFWIRTAFVDVAEKYMTPEQVAQYDKDDMALASINMAKELANTNALIPSELQGWMTHICEKMKTYIMENGISVILSNDLINIENFDYMNANCAANGYDFVVLNMLAALEISTQQDLIAQRILDAKTDNQRILEVIAISGCRFEKSYTRYLQTGQPRVECTPDGNRCVVNQDVNSEGYSACCVIEYNKEDYIIEKNKEYDMAGVQIRTNGFVSAPSVRFGDQYFPASRDMTLADFDENCRSISK